MSTPAELIERVGGPGPLSRRINVPSTTVGNWHARNSIPARYHHAVLQASDGKITAEEMIQAHAPASDDAGRQPEAA